MESLGSGDLAPEVIDDILPIDNQILHHFSHVFYAAADKFRSDIAFRMGGVGRKEVPEAEGIEHRFTDRLLSLLIGY